MSGLAAVISASGYATDLQRFMKHHIAVMRLRRPTWIWRTAVFTDAFDEFDVMDEAKRAADRTSTRSRPKKSCNGRAKSIQPSSPGAKTFSACTATWDRRATTIGWWRQSR